MIRGDGRVFYVDGDGEVRIFASDPWTLGADGRARDPENPHANDLIVATPACDRTSQLRIDPITDHVVYGCCTSSSECTFHDESGAAREHPATIDALWPGHGHDLVASTFTLQVATGATAVDVDVSALPDAPSSEQDVLSVRARSDGFDVLYRDFTGDVLHLAHVGFDGSSSHLGTFDAPPEGIHRNGWSCVLDGLDRAHCTGNRSSGSDVVMRFTLDPAGVEIIHDEADDPLVRLHASPLFTGP